VLDPLDEWLSGKFDVRNLPTATDELVAASWCVGAFRGGQRSYRPLAPECRAHAPLIRPLCAMTYVRTIVLYIHTPTKYRVDPEQTYAST
jgi:hypothetical protein